MPCCAAPSCTNSSRKGFRTFRFPRDAERRQLWISNCNRGDWIPTQSSRLCEVHFDETQYEQNRADNWKKLKVNAVPTVFKHSKRTGDEKPAVAETRHREKRQIKEERTPSPKTKKKARNDGELHADNHGNDERSPRPQDPIEAVVSGVQSFSIVNEKFKTDHALQDNYNGSQEKGRTGSKMRTLQEKVWRLEKRIQRLNAEKRNMAANLKKLFTDDQIRSLAKDKRQKTAWGSETVMKAFRVRFALGIRGYVYLRKTLGYPCPGYSTLNKRLKDLDFSPGLLRSILPFLEKKVTEMRSHERDCVVSFDEIEAREGLVHDKHNKTDVGRVTLGGVDGDDTSRPLGNRILVALACGLATPWKQIVGYEVTRAPTSGANIRSFLSGVVRMLRDAGLRVVGVISPYEPTGHPLWAEEKVGVTRDHCVTSYRWQDDRLHAFTNVRQVLRSLWLLLHTNPITLDAEVAQRHGMTATTTNACSTLEVRHSYVTNLWDSRRHDDDSRQQLGHLQDSSIAPSTLQKANAAHAIRYFSLRTAEALECGIRLRELPPEAGATAWFVRLVAEWYQLMTARTRRRAITTQNGANRVAFLGHFVEVVRSLRVGGADEWKPVQGALVLCTISVVNVSKQLFKTGHPYVLPGHLWRDALEETAAASRGGGRIRRTPPNVLQCCRAIKSMCVSHFLAIGERDVVKGNDNEVEVILESGSVDASNSEMPGEFG